MWIFLLSLFVFAKDVVGEIDCDKGFFEHCQEPKLYEEIPREVEVFKALCPDLPLYIECSRDYDMKCEKEDNRLFDQPEKYADLIAVLNEICEEGSALNEAYSWCASTSNSKYMIESLAMLVERWHIPVASVNPTIATSNLKCFNETFSNSNCPQEMDDFVNPYQEEVPLDEFTTTHVVPERVSCLSMILLTHCFLTDITRNCGIRALYASVEYVHRARFVDNFCPSSYRKTLLPDIDEFKLTAEQKTFAIAELERMKISDDF